MLWLAALLAALLPVERLVAPDAEAGVLDQFAVRGIADEGVAAAKIVAHWLGFGPPLMLAALPGAALLGLDGATLARLELGLVIGTPALAALGVTVAALTTGLRGAGALAGLVLLPLARAAADLRRGRPEPRRWRRDQTARCHRAAAHRRCTLCCGCRVEGASRLTTEETCMTKTLLTLALIAVASPLIAAPAPRPNDRRRAHAGSQVHAADHPDEVGSADPAAAHQPGPDRA